VSIAPLVQLNTETISREVALDWLRGFFREKSLLLIGSGVSCALDLRFGMSALRDALLESIARVNLTLQQSREWSAVVEALNKGDDLENSLNCVSDDDLIDLIAEHTGNFVASVDSEYGYSLATESRAWPATRLLKRIVEGLPEGDPALHIITPNYDTLLEHSCCGSGIPFTNGFTGNIVRTIDWPAAQLALGHTSRIVRRGHSSTVFHTKKHICLHKMHGSLSYFFCNNQLVESYAWMWNPPAGIKRVIITPGMAKYELLQRFRRELQSRADVAIENENQFLFLGYGFNDKHLEEYISRKLVQQGCKGLIITRDRNERITSLMSKARQLWLVSKADLECGYGTLISRSGVADPLLIPGKNLWNVEEFTTEIIGA